MTSSCIESRLSHYVELTASEKKLLADLEAAPEERGAGEVLFHETDPVDYLYIVKKGWLLSSNLLVDGERQILQMHFPGDLLGCASIAFSNAVATVTSVSPVVVCKFPRSNLGDLFVKEPRLAALLYSVLGLENVNLTDRLKTLGRTNGKARLCNLFLSIFSQLRIVEGNELTEIELPLRQRDLADAVGMSEVHVYRIIAEMEVEGLIEKKRRRLKLLDEDRMAELGQFDNRMTHIDTRWYPAAPEHD